MKACVETSLLCSCHVEQVQGCLSVRCEQSSRVIGGPQGSVQQGYLNGFPKKLLVFDDLTRSQPCRLGSKSQCSVGFTSM